MKGDVVIDKMSGMVYRDGKVLGRKNWIVQADITIDKTDELVIKAIDQKEAEKRARASFEHKYGNENVFVDIVACWSPE
tara:strand:+ start:163 stop:399 length:237 start_codon:yes stop_codon:yes gene_type:complete